MLWREFQYSKCRASTDGAEKCHGKPLEQICDFQGLTGQGLSARLFLSHHFMASNHTLPTDRRIRGQYHFGVLPVALASGRGRDLRKPSRHRHQHLISIPPAHEADKVLSALSLCHQRQEFTLLEKGRILPPEPNRFLHQEQLYAAIVPVFEQVAD